MKRTPEPPFDGDPTAYFRHLRARGFTPKEAMAKVRERFPHRSAFGRSDPPEPPRDELTRLRAERYEMQDMILALGAALAQARTRITALEEQLEAADAQPADPLFKQVGLVSTAPDFVLRAARRAFRGEFHPDRFPPDGKATAEAEFKRFEGVFDQIFALRGLR